MNKDQQAYLRLRTRVQFAIDRLERDNNTVREYDSGKCADIMSEALSYPTITEVQIILDGVYEAMLKDRKLYQKDWDSEDRNGDSLDFVNNLDDYMSMLRGVINGWSSVQCSGTSVFDE